MKTSTTAQGREHEEYIAKLYGGDDGRRSGSSGANPFDRGDVRFTLSLSRQAGDTPLDSYRAPTMQSHNCIGECKSTTKKSISIKKDVWDKIKQEADDANRIPMMFIRFIDENGKPTDLVVREVNIDVELLDA